MIGVAERALEAMCQRALSRTTFGKRLAERANIQDWIAESRIELEMARLLTMKTAWLMDTVGNKAAAVEISAIKVAVPNTALRVLDRAIQVHGAAGMSGDFPMAAAYAAVAPCASPTDRTRCTSSRSPGESSSATTPSSAPDPTAPSARSACGRVGMPLSCAPRRRVTRCPR